MNKSHFTCVFIKSLKQKILPELHISHISMQQLQLSFKRLSSFSAKQYYLHSPLWNNTQTNGSLTSKHLFNSSLTQPHFCLGSSRSWKSFHTLSQGFSTGILKKVGLSGLLQNQRRGFLDHVLFMRTQFQKRHYHQRSSESRESWFLTTDNVIVGLALANIAVFMLWRSIDPTFMMKNFMISVKNVASGRLHTMITSAFSQIDLEHITSNMLGLFVFGTSIGNMFGPKFLLQLYLAGALGGSVFFLVHQLCKSPNSKGVDPKKVPALGASGAVNAIMLLKIFMQPRAIYYVELVVPSPAFLLGTFFIGHDIYMMYKKDSKICGAGHMGGAFVAALVWARVKKRWI